MIDIAIEDLVFAVCALVGGGLLLVTLLDRDGIGSAINAVVGGVSVVPLLLAFVLMFGVGGLFATQVVDVHDVQAAVAGTGSGVVGVGIAYIVYGRADT
jgi:hypothetical protein